MHVLVGVGHAKLYSAADQADLTASRGRRLCLYFRNYWLGDGKEKPSSL